MYFKEKEDTNLDNEFKSNKKININPKYILIALGGIILLVGLIFLIKLLTKNDKYFIELLGDENITLYQGNEYVEPGYRGYDQKDNDLTDDVLVENKLDINTIGEYSITYSLQKTKVTRNIKIVAKPDTATYIYLYGKTTMYLDVGEEYVEPKCIVFNSSGTDLNNKVKITNNIDNKVAGTYQVIYSVTNEDGISVTAIRIVIVMDSEVTYKLSPSGYTNGSVTINLEILDPYYKYMILPDGNKVTSKTYQYQVSQNGTYKIETYNTKDTKKETNIKIDTIDTVKPSGSCSGYYKDGISYINVSASDNTGISKYVLNNQTYTTNNIKYNGELKTVSITIYDNVNNQSSISCNLQEKKTYKDPIYPPSGANIVFKEEKETLIATIEKSGLVYITRVWMKDPYTQANKINSPEYGVNLYPPIELFQKAIASKNLQNKLVIAFNASGFYSDNFEKAAMNVYPGYRNTSVGSIVITDGQVIRNVYDKPYLARTICGIASNGHMLIFNDDPSMPMNERKTWADSVINSGIRNTYSFRESLIVNGQVSTDISPSKMPEPTTKLNRQVICEVNENNYVLITGQNLNRSDLITKMQSLNCQNGINLDGGGSTALMYKSSNSTNIEKVMSTTRPMPEIGYFTE